MTPSPETRRNVERLNEIFRQELGDAARRFSWQWSEDLTIGMWTGVFEYAPAHTPGGAIGCRAVYTPRKLSILNTAHYDINDQWVLCEMGPPVTFAEWRARNSLELEWPSRGYWKPCLQGGYPIHLAPGQEPDRDLTLQWARLIHAELGTTARQHYEEIVRREATAAAIRRSATRDATLNALLPFSETFRPGGKQNWTAGGIGSNRNERKEQNGNSDATQV